MHRFSSGLFAVGGLLAVFPAALPAQAQGTARGQKTTPYHEDISELAKRHRVPERLVHRIIVRESRYNARAQHAGNYGLMQIKPATARAMGYRGAPAGLLVARTNLTYAVPYLANAYRVAGGNEDRAVQLYAGGYYYAAKRKGMLAALRTAHANDAAAEAPLQSAAVTVRPPTAPSTDTQAYAAPVSPFEALASIFSPPTGIAIPEAQAGQPAAEEQPRKRERRRRR